MLSHNIYISLLLQGLLRRVSLNLRGVTSWLQTMFTNKLEEKTTHRSVECVAFPTPVHGVSEQKGNAAASRMMSNTHAFDPFDKGKDHGRGMQDSAVILPLSHDDALASWTRYKKKNFSQSNPCDKSSIKRICNNSIEISPSENAKGPSAHNVCEDDNISTTSGFSSRNSDRADCDTVASWPWKLQNGTCGSVGKAQTPSSNDILLSFGLNRKAGIGALTLQLPANSAKRILEELENMSSPVRDARKIPVDSFSSEGFPSSRTDRGEVPSCQLKQPSLMLGLHCRKPLNSTRSSFLLNSSVSQTKSQDEVVMASSLKPAPAISHITDSQVLPSTQQLPLHPLRRSSGHFTALIAEMEDWPSQLKSNSINHESLTTSRHSSVHFQNKRPRLLFPDHFISTPSSKKMKLEPQDEYQSPMVMETWRCDTCLIDNIGNKRYCVACTAYRLYPELPTPFLIQPPNSHIDENSSSTAIYAASALTAKDISGSLDTSPSLALELNTIGDLDVAVSSTTASQTGGIDSAAESRSTTLLGLLKAPLAHFFSTQHEETSQFVDDPRIEAKAALQQSNERHMLLPSDTTSSFLNATVSSSLPDYSDSGTNGNMVFTLKRPAQATSSFDFNETRKISLLHDQDENTNCVSTLMTKPFSATSPVCTPSSLQATLASSNSLSTAFSPQINAVVNTILSTASSNSTPALFTTPESPSNSTSVLFTMTPGGVSTFKSAFSHAELPHNTTSVFSTHSSTPASIPITSFDLPAYPSLANPVNCPSITTIATLTTAALLTATTTLATTNSGASVAFPLHSQPSKESGLLPTSAAFKSSNQPGSTILSLAATNGNAAVPFGTHPVSTTAPSFSFPPRFCPSISTVSDPGKSCNTSNYIPASNSTAISSTHDTSQAEPLGTCQPQYLASHSTSISTRTTSTPPKILPFASNHASISQSAPMAAPTMPFPALTTPSAFPFNVEFPSTCAGSLSNSTHSTIVTTTPHVALPFSAQPTHDPCSPMIINTEGMISSAESFPFGHRAKIAGRATNTGTTSFPFGTMSQANTSCVTFEMPTPAPALSFPTNGFTAGFQFPVNVLTPGVGLGCCGTTTPSAESPLTTSGKFPRTPTFTIGYGGSSKNRSSNLRRFRVGHRRR
uniref:RanBP2-type domain-containing protein n=1 Tax=Eptatretus burgeri TaxID=7764 RepID=A0A8C4Q1X6_EPTBU